MHFSGFITLSLCVPKIMEHADDVSKSRDFAGCLIHECYDTYLSQQ